MAAAAKIEGLETFAKDERLAQLDEARQQFNVFEAVGAAHKELWHSDFLAFLLDPAQNHHLGDEFIKRLLWRAIPDLAEIDSWEGASVRREYRYIDILIEEEQQQVSVIIENKIWSPEAPGQLAWYWKTITEEHPDKEWRTRGIFLTPRGTRPLEALDRERYRVLSYRDIRDILDEVLEAQSGHLDTDVKMTIRHYIDMLGRFIVGNADTEALARKLYFEHRSAVKLMNPTLWKGWIKSHLEHLIKESPGLQPEVSNLEYVRFRVGEWDRAEGLKAGTDKTTSYPMLFFDFYNYEDSLTLYLWVWSGMPSEVHANFLRMLEQSGPPFCAPKKEGSQWHYGYRLAFLTKGDYETRTDEELKEQIYTRWQQFVEQDLPGMLRILKPATWFWGSADAANGPV
jgi:hypothetical protein